MVLKFMEATQPTDTLSRRQPQQPTVTVTAESMRLLTPTTTPSAPQRPTASEPCESFRLGPRRAKTKNKQKKNHKTKNKTKKDVKIQATKNQPNQEASTTSGSRVPTHRSGEQFGRAPCPGERGPRPWLAALAREAPSRLGQGASERGGGLGVQSRLPPQAVWGPAAERAAGLSRESGPQDLTFVANCASGGDGWLGRARGGAAFHSQGSGFGHAHSPCVARSGPQLPLMPCHQCPCPANLPKEFAGH